MSFLSRSFLWGMLIWLAPFLRWQMGNEAKFKKNIWSREITATIENEKVIVNYGEKPYQSVRLEEIESIKIIENLPNDLSRIAGTATDNLYKGSWKSEELNNNGLTLCLDPKVGPYIMPEKKSGNILLFGMRSPDETLEVYKMIEEIK